jgi:ADP-ribose pyrophosphatase YjhB (NUDIX family)
MLISLWKILGFYFFVALDYNGEPYSGTIHPLSDSDLRHRRGTMNHPPIGIAVLIFKNGRILLGRCGKDWHFPQGILSSDDQSLERAAERVSREFAGVTLKDVRFLCYKTWSRQRPVNGAKHSFYFTAVWTAGRPQPKKQTLAVRCDVMEWFDPNLLPHPLFVSRHQTFDKGTMRSIRRIAKTSK